MINALIYVCTPPLYPISRLHGRYTVAKLMIKFYICKIWADFFNNSDTCLSFSLLQSAANYSRRPQRSQSCKTFMEFMASPTVPTTFAVFACWCLRKHIIKVRSYGNNIDLVLFFCRNHAFESPSYPLSLQNQFHSSLERLPTSSWIRQNTNDLNI